MRSQERKARQRHATTPHTMQHHVAPHGGRSPLAPTCGHSALTHLCACACTCEEREARTLHAPLVCTQRPAGAAHHSFRVGVQHRSAPLRSWDGFFAAFTRTHTRTQTHAHTAPRAYATINAHTTSARAAHSVRIAAAALSGRSASLTHLRSSELSAV